MPLEIVRNDITKMRVDAIVNAANTSLLGGGGVDGAIHRAAGPKLLEECRTLNGCKTGEAKITGGYRLPCKYVIHTPGPIWRGGAYNERELLAACYKNSLELAKKYDCETVAFPLISSGVYGYPKAQALEVAVDAISHFLWQNDMTVYIVVFSRDAFEISGRLFNDVKAYIDDVYVHAHQDLERESMRASMQRKLFKRTKEYAQPMKESGEEFMAAPPLMQGAPGAQADLDDMLSQIDESFAQMLLRVIDEKGLSDAVCYKRANIDRRLFNKIKNNPSYKPSKQTVLAFAVALELSLDQTREMLMKAGFALSHSNKADIVVEYCIMTHNYNIMEINQVLFKLDLQPLGY